MIGDPVGHSRSPAIHNAAFAALDLDWVYVALPTPEGRAVAAVEGMRATGLRGMSVTMPHKAAVIPALDELTSTAERLGSVNCIIRDGDRLIGDSTDGAGFVSGLRHDFGLDPGGARCVVLGAGGAARAVVLALADAGAASVGVVNRTAARGREAAALAGPRGALVAADAVAEADLVVNATSIGMADTGGGPAEVPLDPSQLRAGQVVAELIYHPERTALDGGRGGRRLSYLERSVDAGPPGRRRLRALDRGSRTRRRHGRRRAVLTPHAPDAERRKSGPFDPDSTSLGRSTQEKLNRAPCRADEEQGPVGPRTSQEDVRWRSKERSTASH